MQQITFKKIFQENVIKDYENLKSIKKVSIKNKISTRQVLNILNKNNICHSITRKIKLNENFFENFDDSKNGKDVMYWAGFIAADGNVMNKKQSRNYFMTVKLSLKDINHLKKLKIALESNAKIKTNFSNKRIINEKECNPTESCVVVFNSKKLVNSLEKFNIFPAKSKIYSIPNWIHKHKYVNHFVRGILDGDGTLMFHNKYKRICFYGTKECLENISEIIFNNCNVKKRAISKNRTIFSVQYNGKDTEKLIKWLYFEANTFLDRKFDIINKIK